MIVILILFVILSMLNLYFSERESALDYLRGICSNE